MQTRAARADRAGVDLRRLVAGFLRMANDVPVVGEVRDREGLPDLLSHVDTHCYSPGPEAGVQVPVSQTAPRRPGLEQLARISQSSVVGRSAVRLGVDRLLTLSPSEGPRNGRSVRQHWAGGGRQMRRSGASTAARRLDVLAQMICAHVLARSAYPQSARDRRICAVAGGRCPCFDASGTRFRFGAIGCTGARRCPLGWR
jgi:hypothetical protein